MEIAFKTFPTPEAFAQAAGCTPAEAEVILRNVAQAVGTEYGVSRNGAIIAALAVKNGMGYGQVAAVFGSWYEDFERSRQERP